MSGHTYHEEQKKKNKQNYVRALVVVGGWVDVNSMTPIWITSNEKNLFPRTINLPVLLAHYNIANILIVEMLSYYA